MLINRFLALFVVVLCLCTKTHAQLNANTTGSASALEENCFLITPDALSQAGGVWYDNPIDFSENFTIFYQNNFGNKDFDGADGMALVFKRTPNAIIGNSGGDVGYGGIPESLVVEFDTYQNIGGSTGESYNDPAYDHIAIMANGVANHSSTSNLAGPVVASGNSDNIEDGSYHEVKIEWSASNQILNVYFDCDLRLSLNEDVKNTIFSGDDTVFFGFVGSTGGLSNLHQVCFNSISFVENLTLQDQSVCEGESVSIDASIPSGDAYNWFPIEGVSNPEIPNPEITASETTTYTVTISDVCGDITTESVTITVIPDAIPDFDNVSPICFGDSIADLPTNSTNGISGSWSPDLNNSSTTTYTFTPDPGQCASEVNMTIVVNPVITPDFDAINPIFIGENLDPLPTVSNNGIVGSWSPALNNTETTTYTFTPAADQCAEEVSLTIEVLSGGCPDILTAIDALSKCIGEEVELEISILNPEELSSQISIVWSINGTQVQSGISNTFIHTADSPVGTLTVTVTDESAQCSTQSTISVAYYENAHCIDIPQGISPNNDGFNDCLVLDHLEDKEDIVKAVIYNRYGRKVFELNTYTNQWCGEDHSSGNSNGKLLPVGTYFYTIYFASDRVPINSWIYLNY